MLWYLSLLIESALALRLILYHDGRPWFEALIIADVAVQVVQRFYDSAHVFAVSVPVFYIGQAIAFPLLIKALHEAAAWPAGIVHRSILFAWVSATMLCAWVRIFPYTGVALLAVNIAAFTAWIADCFAQRR